MEKHPENQGKPYIDEDEEVLDLKELLLFILRKWRVLILLVLVGVIVGAGFGLLKKDRTIEDIEDISELHLKEIEQYARYQQAYQEQLDYEKESVYLNMDPAQVYTGSKTYLMRVDETDVTAIRELYGVILRNSKIYEDLIQASGLGCTQRAIKELVGIGVKPLEEERNILIWKKPRQNVTISLSAVAPTQEACQKMMNVLDEQVRQVTTLVQEKYGVLSHEVLLDDCSVGYHSGIEAAKTAATEKRGNYIQQMSTLEKTLTKDDMLYYEEMYPAEKKAEEKGPSFLKWALIIGILFGFLGFGIYAVQFISDGHMKTVDELLAYGLHVFTCMEETESKPKHATRLDRLLKTKLQYNTAEYLVNALNVMETHPILLCGDQADADVTAVLAKAKEQDPALMVSSLLTVDESAYSLMKEAESVVLLVHLWKTKRADFEQELRICQKAGRDVAGVVVIG